MISSMWEDPFVEEVRRTRERLFAEVGNDLDRLIEKLRELEGQEGRPVVSLAPRRVAPRGPGPAARDES